MNRKKVQVILTIYPRISRIKYFLVCENTSQSFKKDISKSTTYDSRHTKTTLMSSDDDVEFSSGHFINFLLVPTQGCFKINISPVSQLKTGSLSNRRRRKHTPHEDTRVEGDTLSLLLLSVQTIEGIKGCSKNPTVEFKLNE